MFIWGAVCMLVGAGLSLRYKVWSLVPVSLMVSLAQLIEGAPTAIARVLVGVTALQVGFIVAAAFNKKHAAASKDVVAAEDYENIIHLAYRQKLNDQRSAAARKTWMARPGNVST